MGTGGNTDRPRLSERIPQGYFLYSSVLALFLPVPEPVRFATLAAIAVLVWLPRLLGQGVSALVRNLVPIACVLLAYRQMGWFAQPHEAFELERAWVPWDRILLADWGLQTAIEAAGPVLPGLLELLYLLTY